MVMKEKTAMGGGGWGSELAPVTTKHFNASGLVGWVSRILFFKLIIIVTQWRSEPITDLQAIIGNNWPCQTFCRPRREYLYRKKLVVPGIEDCGQTWQPTLFRMDCNNNNNNKM